MTKRSLLAHTLPLNNAGAAPGLGIPARVQASPDEAPPRSSRTSLTSRLAALGLVHAPSVPRFEIRGVLGSGATARIIAIEDHDLARPLALKLLLPSGASLERAEVERFLEEARITAALQHPNVLPVHEIDVTDAGQLFFTMQQVKGHSLGSVIESSTPTQRQRPLDDVNSLVSAMIGVGQALAYAHNQRIVHQDVKPDNIMLGEYGEVHLVDWGSAIRLGGEQRLYGTPLYMSPEQARNERVDERSDVYCLGATLFHALTLRLPTWSDDPDTFWRQKRRGELTPPSAAERARLPAALLAIALKALEPDAAARYAHAGAMVDELRRYQGGLAVMALREPWWKRLRRWHRQHARVLWAWTVSASCLIALLLALLGERLEELARWGSALPTVRIDAHWQEHWLPEEGHFALQGDRLVSMDSGVPGQPPKNVLVCRERLDGPIAIEYDAEIEPGPHPYFGDLSLAWIRKLSLTPNHARVTDLNDAMIMQVGAWCGTCSQISKRSSKTSSRVLAWDAFRPQIGVPVHVRIEIIDTRLSMWINGRLACTWIDPFCLEGGYIGLVSYYPGKAFWNLEVHTRSLPHKLPATAIGDAEARASLWDLAESEYAGIAGANLGTKIGEEALYKQGLCRWRTDDRVGAMALWAGLTSTTYNGEIRLHQAEIDEAVAGDDPARHARVAKELGALYRDGDEELRRAVAIQWGAWIQELATTHPEVVDSYREVRSREFPRETAVDTNEADALLTLHRDREILARFPLQRADCCRALLDLGEFKSVVDDYPEQYPFVSSAAFWAGLWDRIDRQQANALWLETLWMQGRSDEALANSSTSTHARAMALQLHGRLDEELALCPAEHATIKDRAVALCFLGHASEAAALDDAGARYVAALATAALASYNEAGISSDVSTLHTEQALLTYIRGDPATARRLIPDATKLHGASSIAMLNTYILLPFCDAVARHDVSSARAAIAAAARSQSWNSFQRIRYWSQLITGAIDDAAFLAQPFRAFAHAESLLCHGMGDEIAGRPADAFAAYSAYLTLPEWSRVEQPDGALVQFVQWRLRACHP